MHDTCDNSLQEFLQWCAKCFVKMSKVELQPSRGEDGLNSWHFSA